MSLRERKKQQTRASILSEAAALFAEHGLQAATMEEIATRADVSVGTVYNYFGSKQALVLALFNDETEAMARQAAAVLAEPSEEPLESVERVLAAYLDRLFQLDRELLRQVVAAGFGSSPDFAEELIRMDMRLVEQLSDLLSHYQKRGLVSNRVAAPEAAMLLYSAMVAQLMLYLMEDVVPDVIRSEIRRQVEVAFGGFRATHTDDE